MESNITEWLSLFGSWAHIIFGIAWISSSLIFINNLSGRAAYIHLGIMLATWMVLNVWVHIVPAQKKCNRLGFKRS